jgi:hypothetical protein
MLVEVRQLVLARPPRDSSGSRSGWRSFLSCGAGPFWTLRFRQIYWSLLDIRDRLDDVVQIWARHLT